MRQEITEKLKKAGKPINEQEVRKEASLRAVDQTVEEYPGAIFLTKYLRNTLKPFLPTGPSRPRQ